jgi:hypothetical protein
LATEGARSQRYAGNRLPAAYAWSHPLAAPLAVAVLVLVSVIVRVWLAHGIATPWILVDELLYADLAKSASAGHLLQIRGQHSGLYNVLYPLLIAPAWRAGSMATTYTLAKVINVVVMTLAAPIFYLWARRLVSSVLAVIGVALVLAMPAFIYTGELMTENAFFPAFLLACFAIAVALERPTLLHQIAALLAVGLTIAVRAQGVLVALVLVAALFLKLALDARVAGRRAVVAGLRAYAPMLGVLVVLGLGYVAYKASRGATLSSGLGAYGGVTSAHYSLGAVRHWTTLHFAEIGLSVAVIPLSALILLTSLAFWRGTHDDGERAFVAVAVAAVLIIVFQAAVFASHFSGRIEERNMFHVAPLLLLSLVVWIERGLPRPPVLTGIAAAVPALLLFALPLGSLLNIAAYSDTLGLMPLLRVQNLFNGDVDAVRWLMIAGGIGAALLFLFVPRRFALALPVLVGVFLILSSWTAYGAIKAFAQSMANGTFGGSNASWIDNAVGTAPNVAFVFGPTTGAPPAFRLWETEFWNRSVGHVYNLGVPEPAGGLAERAGALDPARGLISLAGAADERYIVVESDLRLNAQPLAQHGQLTLYRLRTPIQMADLVSGAYGDGWMGADSSYTRYVSKRPGAVAVTVSRAAWGGPDVPGHVTITVAPRVATGTGRPFATRRWVVHSSRRRRFVLRTPAQPYVVSVHIAPTFSPAQFGQSDTRQLGAQVRFVPDVRGDDVYGR